MTQSRFVSFNLNHGARYDLYCDDIYLGISVGKCCSKNICKAWTILQLIDIKYSDIFLEAKIALVQQKSISFKTLARLVQRCTSLKNPAKLLLILGKSGNFFVLCSIWYMKMSKDRWCLANLIYRKRCSTNPLRYWKNLHYAYTHHPMLEQFYKNMRVWKIFLIKHTPEQFGLKSIQKV